MHLELQRACDLLRRAADGLDGAAFASGPAGKWTAAQIVEHLGKAYASTAYIVDRGLAQGRPKGGTPSWRQRLSALVVLDLGYFPTGRPAPDVTLPADAPPGDVVERAVAALADMDRALSAADARFGPQVALANHPILGPFTAREWRRFHLVHTRHHARQIARRTRGTR